MLKDLPSMISLTMKEFSTLNQSIKKKLIWRLKLVILSSLVVWMILLRLLKDLVSLTLSLNINQSLSIKKNKSMLESLTTRDRLKVPLILISLWIDKKKKIRLILTSCSSKTSIVLSIKMINIRSIIAEIAWTTSISLKI